MAKYISNRQQNLKIGINSYTENKTVLEVTGKVGIGTTNATSKLYVVGDGYFTGVVTATTFYGDGSQLTGISASGGIAISTNTTNQSQYIPYATSFGSTTGLGATTLLVYNPSTGNLGIGTTNPQTKLQINGVLGFGTFDNSGTRTNIRIGDNTTGANLTDGYDNIFMGIGAGNSITTGYNNNFFGPSAGKYNTDGSNNNFLGNFAGVYNTGSNNNFFGQETGAYNTGSYNNFFSIYAGYCNTTGSSNNFFGKNAGYYNTTGCSNNFFGGYAGYCNTTGNYNFFVGLCAGYCNTEGCHNNFFGQSAGQENTSGYHNNFFGQRAGQYNTTGSCNNFLGSQAGRFNTTGSHNTFFGCGAGYCNTTGFGNNFIGCEAGCKNTTGSRNNFFGPDAGESNVTGSYNNFFGSGAGANHKSGSHNTFIGREAGKNTAKYLNGGILSISIDSSTTLIGEANNSYYGVSVAGGNGNSATFHVTRDANGDVSGVTISLSGLDYQNSDGLTIDGADVGGSSGTDDITLTVQEVFDSSYMGSNNTFIGQCAGYCNTTGSYNNFFSYRAGYYNTTGNYNNFFGANAGYYNTTGNYNNFFGAQAGYYNTTGTYNNFIGRAVGRSNTTGCYNNFFGNGAGYYNTTGSDNNFFGRFAGRYNTTGTFNTFLGNYTGISTSASNKIILGRGPDTFNVFDAPDTTKDTQLAIGIRTDSNPANYWLVGNENFNVGIGTTNPTSKLTVGGDISNNYATYGSVTSTASTTSAVGIHSALPVATYRSVEYFIQATSGSRYHASKILSIHDGSTAYNTTYGDIFSNGSIATFDVDISGGNVRLVATASTSASVTYIINYITNKV